MHTYRWRRLASLMLVVVALCMSGIPTTSAQTYANADWFGWGVNVDFKNNTPRVQYVLYVGQNTPTVEVFELTRRDLYPTDCQAQNLQIANEIAYFNGSAGIRCRIPNLRDELYKFGYELPSGEFCLCRLIDKAPFWTAADLTLEPVMTPTTAPLFDGSELRVNVNLLQNGNNTRAQLIVARSQGQPPATYTTPAWQNDFTNGDRFVMGWHGRAVVKVADYFHWLDYLTDPGWRPFYNTLPQDKLGYWHESLPEPSDSGTTNLQDYELDTDGGMLYIGFSPSNQTSFKGYLKQATLDPGCGGI